MPPKNNHCKNTNSYKSLKPPYKSLYGQERILKLRKANLKQMQENSYMNIESENVTENVSVETNENVPELTELPELQKESSTFRICAIATKPTKHKRTPLQAKTMRSLKVNGIAKDPYSKFSK